jgi:predicted  nucleic acid-binding Zn-ribbon protein
LIGKKGGTKQLGKLGKRLSNIDKQIAAAKKSGDKDALKVLKKRREAVAKQMAEIRQLISRRNDALSDMSTARQGIATAREGLGDITGTGETGDLASEMKALREAIEEQNRIQAATQSVAGGEIGQAVRDWLSGELVGKTNGYSQSSASVRY